MPAKTHEIRDPIHVFIRLDSDERRVLNSQPFQRLRDIHQLALTYLVYPGATHARFEHSLGVMELAGRIYDTVTNPMNVHDLFRGLIPVGFELMYWRRVLRMAALCHDIGHLPFSHAAERELLPSGWTHERLSYELIKSDYLAPIFKEIKIDPDDVAKLAVGPKEHPEKAKYSDWDALLSEIIVGDAFGADRIDYLLRDSYHAGVAYGRFDHFRLVDTLRILPRSADDSKEPTLGTEQGGLQSAEALLWARYFMYTQLYFHHVRRIYDRHLQEFLQQWLPGGRFSTELRQHLAQTDNEVLAAIRKAAEDPAAPGNDPARRIARREHFRRVYEMNPEDQAVNPNSVDLIEQGFAKEFGADKVRRDTYIPKRAAAIGFPVQIRDGRIQNSLAMSDTLQRVPSVAVDYLFVDPQVRDAAAAWLAGNRKGLIEGTT